MSYSFTVTGDTPEDARNKAAAQLVAIIEQQSNHHKDLTAALENIWNVVALLPRDPAKSIVVHCSGWLNWNADPEQITGVNVSASASLVAKE